MLWIATKGDVIGTFDDVSQTFEPASAGRRYQIRCAQNVELREARSWYRIVDSI